LFKEVKFHFLVITNPGYSEQIFQVPLSLLYPSLTVYCWRCRFMRSLQAYAVLITLTKWIQFSITLQKEKWNLIILTC